jgi:hypothetical protein
MTLGHLPFNCAVSRGGGLPVHGNPVSLREHLNDLHSKVRSGLVHLSHCILDAMYTALLVVNLCMIDEIVCKVLVEHLWTRSRILRETILEQTTHESLIPFC